MPGDLVHAVSAGLDLPMQSHGRSKKGAEAPGDQSNPRSAKDTVRGPATMM